jgi:UDP-glucuronate 4-epimerase
MILVTGVAGFIGMHVTKSLLEVGENVIGIDNLNTYYDNSLKTARLNILKSYDGFSFFEGDIADNSFIENIFLNHRPKKVVNLAAQAGVRYSLENPHAYSNSNLVGFVNILEGCRKAKVKHLVYASSSSVYGSNKKIPFSESDNVDHPVSLYAATKKANELMAHSYSHLYNIKTTGLRYFTVYGPWGRPDMAPWLFTSAIIEGRKINVFNNGNMSRDFTFIDDIAQGTISILNNTVPDYTLHLKDRMKPEIKTPYAIFNIGSHSPIKLLDFIELLQDTLGIKANLNYMPMQPGDVEATYADISSINKMVGFKPSTSLKSGVESWVSWYLDYHDIKKSLS